MIYNDFNGMKLSALGMGNMRLPVLNGNEYVFFPSIYKKSFAN